MRVLSKPHGAQLLQMISFIKSIFFFNADRSVLQKVTLSNCFRRSILFSRHVLDQIPTLHGARHKHRKERIVLASLAYVWKIPAPKAFKAEKSAFR